MYAYFYIVEILEQVVRQVEMSEFLKHVHVFNDRHFVVCQIQHFELLQAFQALNHLYVVEWQIYWTQLVISMVSIVHRYFKKYLGGSGDEL